MKNGLYDIGVVSFVFTPLVLTITLLLCIWWVRTSRSVMDRPGLLLAAAVRTMPEKRRDWGAAMMVELSQLHGSSSRWRFAIGCARVALFPPRLEGLPRYIINTLTRQDSLCGALSVALPPLGLPFLYLATIILEAIGGSPFTTSSRWSNPAVVIQATRAIILLTLSCILAGLPLGIAGFVRRERIRWLSVTGTVLSLSIFAYLMIVMHFFAGAD